MPQGPLDQEWHLHGTRVLQDLHPHGGISPKLSVHVRVRPCGGCRQACTPPGWVSGFWNAKDAGKPASSPPGMAGFLESRQCRRARKQPPWAGWVCGLLVTYTTVPVPPCLRRVPKRHPFIVGQPPKLAPCFQPKPTSSPKCKCCVNLPALTSPLLCIDCLAETCNPCLLFLPCGRSVLSRASGPEAFHPTVPASLAVALLARKKPWPCGLWPPFR